MEALQKRFYGWKMVVFCGLIYAFVGALGLTVGQLSLSYMVLDPEVTLNRTFLGVGFTLFVLAQGLPGPLIGQLVAKKGARFAYIIGGSVTAVAGLLLALFLGSSLWFYLIGFGVLLSLGCTISGQIPGQSTLTNWFVTKRGKAISFMMILAAVIAVSYPLITNAVITAFGWRAAFLLISVLAICGILIAIFLIKNKPSDIGQLPDGGDSGISDTKQPKRQSSVYQCKDHMTAKQALKTPAFWFIVFTSFTCFAALNLNISQAGLHFVSQGFSLSFVSQALSIKAVGGICALLICSQILDKIEPIRVHGIATLLMGCGALLAALFASPVVMIAYYVLVGIGFATQTACMPTELANLFGNTNYPKILGWVLPIMAVLSSLVPTVAGAVYDISGSYVPAFIGLFVIGVLGFIASCLVRLPKVNHQS